MTQDQRMGPGSMGAQVVKTAEAIAAAAPPQTTEGTTQTAPETPVESLKGKVSGAPPSGPLLNTEQLATLRQSLKDEILAEMADDPSREESEGISTPFNQFQLKLAVYGGVDPNDPVPGFHLRWINDEGDKTMRAQMQGYAFVKRNELALDETVAPLNKDLGEYISVYVGTSAHGSPMRAFLMKMPQEKWQKQQAQSQKQNDMIDAAIRRGGIGNPGKSAYVPEHTPIKYEPQRGTLVPSPKSS